MNKLAILIAALALPLLAAAADNTDAIEERQAAFKQIKATIKDIKDALKGPDFVTAEAAAEILVAKATEVTKLFPEDSYQGDTRAKKKIWANWDNFTARQQQLISNAQALLAASKSNDKGELKAAFKAVSKDCKGCHMKYRQIF